MTSHLLASPRRAFLHLRESGGGLAVVFATALLFLALDAASGSLSGEGAALVVVLGVPLALGSRGLGVRAGTASLWVQKPVHPLRYYLAGAAWNVAMAVAAASILLLMLGIVALLVGSVPVAHPVWTVCALSAVPLVVASMASGASMWLPRTGWLLVLAALLFTLYLQVTTTLDPAVGEQPWVRWFGALLPPWESFVSLLDPDELDAAAASRALVRTISYAGAWIGGGVLGLRRQLTNGSMSRVTSS